METRAKACGPIPGGLILTHTHFTGGRPRPKQATPGGFPTDSAGRRSAAERGRCFTRLADSEKRQETLRISLD